jgi:transcriptional regulator with XRE-family HTH domain
MKNSFGEYLKTKRFFSKLTLRDVENLSNGVISNAYLSQLENGKTKNPSAKVLYHLSRIYKISCDKLIEKCIESGR